MRTAKFVQSPAMRLLLLILLLGLSSAQAAPRAKAKKRAKPAAAGAPPITIDVFHTNDIHGWIMQRPEEYDPALAGRMIGGAAALSSYLNARTGPRLLLDAGDWFQGTPEGNGTEGDALVEVFNLLHYDAVEVGNHDFDFGVDNLKRLVGNLKMPALGANVYEIGRKRKPDWLKSFVIKEVAGVKVGIFGLLTTNMRNLSLPDLYRGLEFRREVDEARDVVSLLRGAGATVIIGVTHVGFESPELGNFEGDQTIAREVPGIDLIVGGHTHTFLTKPFREPTHGTLIVQDGTGLSRVGAVTLTIDPQTKRVIASTGSLVRLWIDEAGVDPEVTKALKPELDRVAKIYDVVVGTAADTLLRNRDGEASVGDWMADCERAYSKTDVGLQNGGGIRADLPKGPITLRRLFNIMPFDNRVANLTMSGKLLREVFDHGVDNHKAFMQISGAEMKYDREGPDGSRVADITVGGKPLDPEARYTLSTLDFLVRGGDGYTPFDRAEKKEVEPTLVRDVLKWCVEREKTVVAPKGGRMRPMEASSGSQERAR